jgi:hypothetical protein
MPARPPRPFVQELLLQVIRAGAERAFHHLGKGVREWLRARREPPAEPATDEPEGSEEG